MVFMAIFIYDNYHYRKKSPIKPHKKRFCGAFAYYPESQRTTLNPSPERPKNIPYTRPQENDKNTLFFALGGQMGGQMGGQKRYFFRLIIGV